MITIFKSNTYIDYRTIEEMPPKTKKLLLSSMFNDVKNYDKKLFEELTSGYYYNLNIKEKDGKMYILR